MPAALRDLLVSWGSIYANHSAVRTLVVFAHLSGLIGGGGAAIASDRAILAVAGLDDHARRLELARLQRTHRAVLTGLAVVAASGLLLFASDFETFLVSRVFWAKMLLVCLLLTNGALLVSAERRASAGDQQAWTTLKITAVASLVLWSLTTLGGVALLSIG